MIKDILNKKRSLYYAKKRIEDLKKRITEKRVESIILVLDNVDLIGDHSSIYMNMINEAFMGPNKPFAIDFNDMDPSYVTASLIKMSHLDFKVISSLCGNPISKADYIYLYNCIVESLNEVYGIRGTLEDKEKMAIRLAELIAKDAYSDRSKNIYSVVNRCYADREEFQKAIENVFLYVAKMNTYEKKQNIPSKK